MLIFPKFLVATDEAVLSVKFKNLTPNTWQLKIVSHDFVLNEMLLSASGSVYT